MSALSPMIHARRLLDRARMQQTHARELAQATGDAFNIFQILRVGHLETRTHSPLLVELLNPRGTHGQGATFLRLLLHRIGISDFQIESKHIHVKPEYHVGPCTEDSGGRIDIVIKDGYHTSIYIENKIYAADQDKQILRYHNHDPSAQIVYLTLDGREPPDSQQVGNLKRISYAIDILGWLQDCRKEATSTPIVRETLTQYIHLIQHLTHQNPSARMNQELITAVLASEEDYRAYLALRNAESSIQSTIIASLNTQLHGLADDLQLRLTQTLRGDWKQYDGWFFTTPSLEKQNLSMGFECQSSNYRDFVFGFRYLREPCTSPLSSTLLELARKELGQGAPSNAWPIYLPWDRHPSWTEDTYASIQFGPFINDVRESLAKLINIAHSLCP